MELGEVRYVNIRDVWKTESVDFTPWLAKHLHVLGDELGIDLELIKTEQEVGEFFLDISAKHGDGRSVIIENQFGDSDHKHLGQLITYASGQEAKTVIWICERFRDEHEKALEWLNESSHEGISFFAVEIKVISIDGQKAAPLFKVRVSPNEWFKRQKTKSSQTDVMRPAEKQKNDFYKLILEKIASEKPHLTNKRTTNDTDYLDFNSGKSGYRYWIQFRKGKLSCQLVFIDNEKSVNKERYDGMFTRKEELETKIKTLSWERLDDKKQSKIVSYCPFDQEEDILNWAVLMLGDFKDVFSDFLTLQ